MLSENSKEQKLRSFKGRRLAMVKAALSVASSDLLPRNPVPVNRMLEADLAEIKGVRTWGDQYCQLFRDDIKKSICQEPGSKYALKSDDTAAYNILALSGGGANGAFGAGFLYGWTKAGTRPEFKIVTGISSGAIIAALAFLGAEYDELLKEIYTTVTEWNIYNKKNVLSLICNESFADIKPLEKLIRKYVDKTILKAIAKAHSNGKRLYVGTANLDAQRPVVWNMGAIACSDHPDALKLFCKILLASVSIPCIFPPVYFEVEAAGQFYDEMHVDGGMIADVFICDFMLDFPIVTQNDPKPRNALYIIRNDKFMPSTKRGSHSLSKITERVLSSFNMAHCDDHLCRIYAAARQNNTDFNYTGIPKNCELPDNLIFDRNEMNGLFNLGVRLAKSDYKWHSTLPGFEKITRK